MNIEKGKPSKLFEVEASDEWQTLDDKETFKIAEALADPLRQWAYYELGKGPLRQSELAKHASEFFKKNVTNVLMSYHLQQLQTAGLVKFESDSSDSKRAKIVHRASDMRIQLRQFFGSGARSTEELDDDLSKIFRSRTRR
jgi:predicted transcriptional regulator